MLAWGINMSPRTIVEIDTHPINKLYSTCNLLFRRRLRHLFSFSEIFLADQGRLTFEQLGLLVSFRLPSKSELYLPGASLSLCSDLFKIYRIYLSFDLGRIAVFSSRFIHNLLIFARYIGFSYYFSFYQIYLP